MEAGVVAATPSGSLTAVGTAIKAFVVAHPMAMAATGGALLGITAYHFAGKIFSKKASPVPVPAAA